MFIYLCFTLKEPNSTNYTHFSTKCFFHFLQHIYAKQIFLINLNVPLLLSKNLKWEQISFPNLGEVTKLPNLPVNTQIQWQNAFVSEILVAIDYCTCRRSYLLCWDSQMPMWFHGTHPNRRSTRTWSCCIQLQGHQHTHNQWIWPTHNVQMTAEFLFTWCKWF